MLRIALIGCFNAWFSSLDDSFDGLDCAFLGAFSAKLLFCAAGSPSADFDESFLAVRCADCCELLSLFCVCCCLAPLAASGFALSLCDVPFSFESADCLLPLDSSPFGGKLPCPF